MQHAFPYRLEPEQTGGALIQFVDVPEAHTVAPTAATAGGDAALDCLIAALGGYISSAARSRARARRAAGRSPSCRPWSPPSSRSTGAMRAERITRTALAQRLGVQENAVRRLLDLDHRSHIDQIDRALAALGKRLEVRVLEPHDGGPRARPAPPCPSASARAID
jgi:antitoxin HicB